MEKIRTLSIQSLSASLYFVKHLLSVTKIENFQLVYIWNALQYTHHAFKYVFYV